jgi:glucose/arabinose dehydrogenase
MKRLFIVMAGLVTGSGLFAQGKNEVISEKIEGHIFKPKEVQPTDEKVNSLKLPAGFTVTKFASDLGKPRMMRVAANGTVYVTDRDSGIVTLLRDANKDGKAEVKKVVYRKKNVHGIEISNNDIFLVTVKEVMRGKIGPDGSFNGMRTIINDLPDGGQHANRTIRVGPDNKLYITVGSTCNACEETSKESATVVQTDLNGKGRMVFAKGLRNTIGFDWHPQTKELYGFDHGIDWLGDDEQKEELNRIIKGGDYGWPYIYADGKPNKADEPKKLTWEQYAAKTVKPELLYTAHAAPMNFIFYTGSQFPSTYKNSGFVTMHGSWNRGTPSGYNVVRVLFENGKPVGMEEFITGFLTEDEKAYFGRPCGLVQHTDGSLLMSDDAMGVVYRISYSGR